MNINREDLKTRFRTLADEVLLQRYLSGGLTELALDVAREELCERGIELPMLANEDPVDDQRVFSESSGTLVYVANHLTWIEAQLLCSFLDSEGIPATLADAHMSTTNQFLSIAGGGVRVLVHENNLTKASEIVAAFKRGEYQLDDDFDVEQLK